MVFLTGHDHLFHRGGGELFIVAIVDLNHRCFVRRLKTACYRIARSMALQRSFGQAVRAFASRRPCPPVAAAAAVGTVRKIHRTVLASEVLSLGQVYIQRRVLHLSSGSDNWESCSLGHCSIVVQSITARLGSTAGNREDASQLDIRDALHSLHPFAYSSDFVCKEILDT